MTARRRYQKGQLIDDGDRWSYRWREDVIDAHTQTIKRVRKWDVLASKKECPTRRLAQRKLDDKLREINREDYKPQTTETFGQFAQNWLTRVLIHDKPSTQRSDKSVVNVHLIPSFGEFAFREITAEVMQEWVSEQDSNAKTIRNFVAVMRRMWTTAKAWGYATHDPFAGLKLPTAVKGNVYHFSVEETLAIIEAAQGWKKVFIRILAETGIRPGELAGLRISDVQGRVLHIRQSVWQRQIQTPKTVNAVRKFPIGESLAAAIEEHVKETKDHKNPEGLVFTAETGRPLSMDNFRHRVLEPILEKLKINPDKRCGLYAFRHMNATLMDHLNTPLKTRQSRLGHADPTTTLGNYTHPVSADDLAAADMIGALLAPKKGEAIQ